MGLKEFEFIKESIRLLNGMTDELKFIENEINNYLSKIPFDDGQLINVTSRIKSEASLKEKIIRNRYLTKYDRAEELLAELPDLIGFRIECKFISDEGDIFRIVNKYFNKTDDSKHYYNSQNKNIRLNLIEKQPTRQKNGFEIYKIDGVYNFLNRKINFELQIKSLVNVFWSEIEHKIIYKNTTYLLQDKLLKDMMVSIRNNLTVIDNQLLNIYNNFKPGNVKDPSSNKAEIEKLFAKFLYDTIAKKMESNIGFVVDFKDACETILNYSFNKYDYSYKEMSDFMTIEFSRLSEIVDKNIQFDQEIEIDGNIKFTDDFSSKIAKLFIRKMNEEFPWNLFFTILFEFEPYDNKSDFENFIQFFKTNLVSKDSIMETIDKYGEYSNVIIDDLYECIYICILESGNVNIFYKNNLSRINKVASDGLNYVCYEFDNYYEYMEKRKIISEILIKSIRKIFV